MFLYALSYFNIIFETFILYTQDCNMSTEVSPSYECHGNVLTVYWPTDNVYAINWHRGSSWWLKSYPEREAGWSRNNILWDCDSDPKPTVSRA